MIAKLSTGSKETSRGSASKSWGQYSRQQQYNKRKSLASGIQGALSFCEEGCKPCSVEVDDVIDIASGACSQMDISSSCVKDNSHCSLYKGQFFCLKRSISRAKHGTKFK